LRIDSDGPQPDFRVSHPAMASPETNLLDAEPSLSRSTSFCRLVSALVFLDFQPTAIAGN
jgi:hypothetical protein